MKRLPTILIGSLCTFSILMFAQFTSADSGLSVTVTPPLFQLTIGPGESWTGSLKIVNSNAFDVTYYAQVVDMQANGETGESKFIPIVGPQDPALAASELARWMQLEPGPYTIKAGQSANVHFTVSIPQNAEPGGHYAAILIGTQPPPASGGGSKMSVSSYVSSLIFVRVKGNVIETARIREFTSDQDVYQSPKADFVLRFENTGNTHLKPEGDVTIYNMWGKERGKVLINQQSDFGNVLPKTIRRFEFSWEGEPDVLDIGRYSAVVTLAYGENGSKNISATTYFWVVPVVPVAVTLGSLILFIILLTWFIRRYIRRALELERARYGPPPETPMMQPVHMPILETIVEPIREGVVDLRALRNGQKPDPIRQPERYMESELSTGQFVKKYKLFFAFIAVVLVSAIGLWLYFSKVLVPARTYNITNVPSQSENAGQ